MVRRLRGATGWRLSEGSRPAWTLLGHFSTHETVGVSVSENFYGGGRVLGHVIGVLRDLSSDAQVNWWCDIILDEQDGDGFLMDVLYADALLSIIRQLTLKRSEDEIEVLWSTTEQGREYAFEKRCRDAACDADKAELAILYGTQEERVRAIALHLGRELREMAYRVDFNTEERRAKRRRDQAERLHSEYNPANERP